MRLDPEVLAEIKALTEDEPGSFDEIVQLFGQRSGEIFEQLSNQPDSSDPAIQELCHNLKGICAQMGALSLVKLLEEVMDDPSRLHGFLVDFASERHRTLEELQKQTESGL